VAGAAWAQDATPRLQDADIDARGSRLKIVRLPIDINGKTVYRDIILDFKVNANGDVTIATDVRQPGGAKGATVAAPAIVPTEISPVVVSKPSAPPAAQAYHQGTYRAQDGTVYHLAAHGTRLFGDSPPEWEISVLGPGGKVIDDATWYDGPIDKSPLRKRLRRDGITDQAFSYGVSNGGNGLGFNQGSLIGAAATGKTLTIYSFVKGCCTDTVDATHAVSLELVSAD
jgi:hypothetical protein